MGKTRTFFSEAGNYEKYVRAPVLYKKGEVEKKGRIVGIVDNMCNPRYHYPGCQSRGATAFKGGRGSVLEQSAFFQSKKHRKKKERGGKRREGGAPKSSRITPSLLISKS